MSSRDDRRRRDRSWERDDRERRDRGGGRGRDPRDKERERDRGYRGKEREKERGGRRGDYAGRRSRSRSPVGRAGDRDRRDYGRDRHDDRRDRDRDRYRELDRDRLEEHRDRDRPKDDKEPRRDRGRGTRTPAPARTGPPQTILNGPTASSGSKRPNLDPEWEDGEEREGGQDGEPMDAENDDEAAMRALMGFGGFDSTKGKPVVGNEEGAANIKKMRTWRQYMNRRGGFNRPLDKIK